MKNYQLIGFLIFSLVLSIITSSAFAQEQNNERLNRSPLFEGSYKILPMGSVQPEGWLEEQLNRMADGLAGQLDEIYPNVR